MKLHREEIWLRALEAIIGATEGIDGELSRPRVDRCIDRADEVLEAFVERFRSDEE